MEAISFMAMISFGNIHNDIYDIHIDAINKPNHPLQSGDVSVPIANALIGVFFAIPVIVSIGVLNSMFHSAFFALILLLLFTYNRWFKSIPIVKNLTVALLCTTPLILAVYFQEDKASLIYPVILFAFFFTFIRELVKDIEDLPGDFKENLITFPVLVGEKRARSFATVMMILSLHTLIVPVLSGVYSPSFFVFANIPVTVILLFSLSKLKNKKYKTSQKLIKLAMLIGIIGLVLSQKFPNFYSY
jgi:4-hydroxybenzoate polyprenyltransferase/geranylgeranylglycerol-phosphate geranylgeranyltransferase